MSISLMLPLPFLKYHSFLSFFGLILTAVFILRLTTRVAVFKRLSDKARWV